MPLHFVEDHITQIPCDAIVNLTGGNMKISSPISKEIYKAGGFRLRMAARKLKKLSTGEIKYTKGYKLSCNYVIHMGKLDFFENYSNIFLQECYLKILHLASELNCESVALPLLDENTVLPDISVAIDAIRNFLENKDMTVYLVVRRRKAFTASSPAPLSASVNMSLDTKHFNVFCDYRHTLASASKTIQQKSIRSEQIYSKKLDDLHSMILSDSNSLAPKLTESPASQTENKVYSAKKVFFADTQEILKKEVECNDRYSGLTKKLQNKGKSFAKLLFEFIDQKKLYEPDCYKRSNISKQVFNTIKTKHFANMPYDPEKNTVLAFAIGLRLNIEETDRLLRSSGFSLSDSNDADLIVLYFIETQDYRNIHDVNACLFDHGEKTLGRKPRKTESDQKVAS